MSYTSAVILNNAQALSESRRLSPAAAFLLLASITVSFLAGSSAPTPLYPIYMAQWGLTPLMITVIFGIYALAVLLALSPAGFRTTWAGGRYFLPPSWRRPRRWCYLRLPRASRDC